jgi:NADPH-dependent curcumin reductase CurA
MATTSREIHLKRRPSGVPSPDDFALVEIDVPEPAEGQLLVRNTWMSLDPAMRVRMGGSGGSIGKVPSYELDAPLDGMAVGEVVASTVEGFAPGDAVVHSLGWRDYALPSPANPAHRVARIPGDDDMAVQDYLGLLSLVGFTAWVGLFPIAQMREGDVVWVSAAAGAVGSLAVQIAKLHGHRVIASAGSAEKVAYLRDVVGVDAAFDYHDGPVGELLAAAAPDGIDVYFDNVGGEHLEAALDALNPGGRVALCGLVSTYNSAERLPGPGNLFEAISKGLTIRGFLAVQFADRMEEYRSEARRWVAEGRIDYRETVADGLERAPQALIDLLGGGSIGKMLVRIA